MCVLVNISNSGWALGSTVKDIIGVLADICSLIFCHLPLAFVELWTGQVYRSRESR